MKTLHRDLLAVLVFGVILFFLPGFLHEQFGRASVSYLAFATNALMLALLALSWDILVRTGQLSLAHAAFYGAGGYATAILARFTETPLWLGIPLGGLVAMVLALALGSVTLRLHGIYFAIATLAFAKMTAAVVHHLPMPIAGGAPGINAPALFRPQFVPGAMERWEVAFLRNESYFMVYAGILLLAILVSVYVQHSRLKAAFTAIRTNEQVAEVMGVKPWRYKLLAFALSSFLVGLLGAVEAHRMGSVNPLYTFHIATTVLALVTPIFGGLYTTLGPILGAVLLAGVEEVLSRIFTVGYLIGYGIILVLTILFMPRGLVGLFGQLSRRFAHQGHKEKGP